MNSLFYDTDECVQNCIDEAASFFECRFENVPDDTSVKLGVWGGKSFNEGYAEWYPLNSNGYIAAAEFAIDLAIGGYNAYYTTCPHKGDLRKRGHVESATWVHHLWLDLDLAGKTGSKKEYPSREKAMAFLTSFPFEPSMVVESGPSGLHIYWRLSRALPAQQNIELVKSFQNRFRQQLGADLDQTGDLARVLRIPGTVNYNYKEPALVRVLEDWKNA